MSWKGKSKWEQEECYAGLVERTNENNEVYAQVCNSMNKTHKQLIRYVENSTKVWQLGYVSPIILIAWYV